MSTPHAAELDKMIQVSLVSRVKQAAAAYRGEPAMLDAYLAALESLADYVGARWSGERIIIPDIAAARQRFLTKRPPVSRPRGTGRLIPFAKSASAGGPSPLTAA
jgi:hypothetical protein